MALSRFVSVPVTEQTTVQTVASFSTCLHLAQISATTMPERFASFTSVDEVTDASLPQQVIDAATVFFAQSPNPGELIIGRQVPGTAKVVTVTVTTQANGTWSFDLNGVTVSYLAASNTAQEIATGLRADLLAQYLDVENDVTVSTASGGVFTITANTAGDSFTVGSMTVPGAGAGSTATTTASVAAEDCTTALDAIVDAGGVFYGITIQSRLEAQIDDVATWASARKVMFFAQTADETVRDADAGNMADDLQQLGYDTTDLTWHRDSTEFADVATMAVVLARDLDARNGSTAFKTLTGITADAGDGVVDPLTSSQITNIELAANSYTREGGVSLRFPGQVVSGKRTDTVITRHWLQTRMEEAVFGAFVGAPNGISYDTDGIAIMENVITGVLANAKTAKHISAYSVTMPTLASLSAAVRASRNLPNCRVTATFNGFIETIDVPVFLQY